MLSVEETRLLSVISGQRVFGHVSSLVSPAERASGSPAEAEGAQKVKTLLSPYMDNCELEPVSVTGYFRGKGKLEVISPVSASLTCEVNPVTASGKGEGILIDVSGGTRSVYQKLGQRVEGNIVLVTGDPTISGGLGLVAREAKYQGASCLIYHLPARREDLISVHGANVDLPVLSISSRSAAELRNFLSQYQELRVSFESNLTKACGISYNVVGTVRGSRFPEQVIYLTSHHDTWFQGANDNNATTACLLAVAQMLAKKRPERSVRFVIHGSEESGAEIGSDVIYFDRGSYSYTEFHRAELEGKKAGDIPVCVINGEMLGYSPRSQIQCTAELISFVKDTIADLPEGHLVNEPGVSWTSSDHLCYHTLGTPTIYLTPGPDPEANTPSSYFRLYHTCSDDLEHVSPSALESSAKLLTLIVSRLDAAEVPPLGLESLVETGRRGIELMPNRARIEGLLEDKKAQCAVSLAVEHRTKKMLELARTVNKNIYGFASQLFVHKFATVADTVAKLRHARDLVDTDDNRQQAYQVLLSIAGASTAQNFSLEVWKELESMREQSSLLRRLSIFSLDLSPVFAQITSGEPKKTVLASLESAIEHTEEIARIWGDAFEHALSVL